MTVKEAMTKVSEERETFPMGWNTDLKEVYAKSGRNLFEKKQKWVYLLTIKTPYNHEADTLTLFRDKAKAKAAMEEDIRDTLATGRFDPDDLVRDEDGDNATKVVKVGETEIAGVDNVYAVHYGDTVTVAYTPATGYETADGTKTIANVTGDTTLADLPTVTATAYAITYELDGGENDPANPSSYTIETETITLADPTKTDYTFAGWTPEGVIAKGSTGDKTFTANWAMATVTFTVAAPANASVTKVATNGVEMVAPYAVLPGTAVTVTYTADAGYVFANGTNTMDAEITVTEAGEQPAPQGTETTTAMPKATVAENPIAAAFGGLDAAYTFTTNGVCPAQPVASKNVDYIVSFDNDVESGAIRLAAVMENGWTNFPAMKFTAGTPYALVYSMGKTLSVAEMYAMGSFTCGISNISVKTETKMTVQLVMNDAVPYIITNVTYTLTAKGPIIIPPIGGDPETNPTIKPVEGTNGVYEIEVKTNETTTVRVEGLQTTDKVVVPEQIDTVVGVASNQVIIVGEATNEVGAVVKVDITKAFKIAENDAGVTITLNDDPNVVVKVVIGEKEEDIKVTPELGKSEGTVVAEQPFVVAEEKVAMGVKTIPGLTYKLLSGDTVTEIKTVVKTIVAKNTRVVLEAAKASDPSKFYKIEVVK